MDQTTELECEVRTADQRGYHHRMCKHQTGSWHLEIVGHGQNIALLDSDARPLYKLMQWAEEKNHA